MYEITYWDYNHIKARNCQNHQHAYVREHSAKKDIKAEKRVIAIDCQIIIVKSD